ncbi:MFS transporter [Saccharomonospora sp. CUA-673]|uniref:MFS transporter n=1 Tax=Saccharomonospora sp. CUA-673 TaxID=1904969 RepID=UPI00095D7E65|nr:MFS transporter [Saccharomonospora sp. CUA-673]OLT46953.1 MFS transporter [Saccharomonospora sp. CUA-673]
MAVTLTAGFMSLLDVSIVTLALPSIQDGLDASVSGTQWIVSGYALTFGLVLVTGGRLGDAFGRRRMFLVALSAFVLTSGIAGASSSEEMLIAARLAQGVAAGMLTPQNTGLIQELFHGAERGRAFGMFGATVGLSTAIGPVLGGVIIAAFGDDGWRWVFYVNLPIGLVALALAARWLPTSAPRRKGILADLDVLGMLLLGLAVLGVLLPLVNSEQGGLARLWWMFPLAAAFGWLFVRWERVLVRRGRAPVLHPRLYTDTPGYAIGAAIGAVYFCGFAGMWLVFAMFFQQGLGFSPLVSGLLVTPCALGSAVASAFAGRAVARWGTRVTITGLVLSALGLALVAVLVPVVPDAALGWAVASSLLLTGIGGGMVISPNTTFTLDRVPTAMAGVAGAALQTGQRLGTAVGVAVLASAFHAGGTDGDGYRTGLMLAMVCAVAFTLVALTLAVLDARRNPRRRLATRPAEAGPST